MPGSTLPEDELTQDPDIAAPLFDEPTGPDPLVGSDVAGRYRLTSRVLRGRSGSLYRTEFGPGRPAVLRMFDSSALPIQRPEDLARFETMSSVLRRLVHPNTARILDHGTSQGQAYLVSEYVHGATLASAMGNDALDPERAIHIAQQILGALQEAHARGVVHRDLKPGNVMLTRMGGQWNHVKLVEWWMLSDWDDAVEATGDVDRSARTPMYLSPEQIRGDKIDGRADIYALGVLLYRMLTGTTPFRDGKAPEVLMAHLNEEPRFFSEAAPDLVVPPAIEWTVSRCLEKDPNDRFANVAEASRALAAALIALEDPTRWRLTLALRDGTTVVPQDLQDATASTSLSAIEDMLANAPELMKKVEPTATLSPEQRDTFDFAPAQQKEAQKASGGSLKYALIGAALMIPIAFVAVALTVVGVGIVGVGASQPAPDAEPAVPASAAPSAASAPTVAPAEVAPAIPTPPPEAGTAEVAGTPEPAVVEPIPAAPGKPAAPANRKPRTKPAEPVVASTTAAPVVAAPQKPSPAKEADPFGAQPKSDLKDPFGN